LRSSVSVVMLASVLELQLGLGYLNFSSK
jgi:hypothetical protein